MWPKLHPSPTYLLRAALTALVTLTSSSAFGIDQARASLELSAAEQANCGSLNALKTAIEQRLQRRLFVPAAEADLKVVVNLSRASNDWIADIDLYTVQGKHLGHRRLVSPTPECTGLDDSLALVVALMVDLTKADISAHTTPTESPDVRTTEVRVPAPQEPENTRSAVLSLGPVAMRGQLPRFGPGVELATELRTKADWAITFGILAFQPVTVTDGATAKATFSQYSAEAGACWLGVRRNAGELLLCGGSQFGLIRAAGTGYAANRSAQSLSISPYLEADSIWWPWTKVGFLVGLGALMPLVRDQFYATRTDGSTAPLFKPAIVVPYLHAGLCLAL